MASTQKKSGGGSASGRSASTTRKNGSGGTRRASSGPARSAPSRSRRSAQTPYRREVWGVVCLLLALFGAIGYFLSDGIVITWFCDLLKGLLGYGFYIAPPMLLAASAVLLFHRGRPVRLRVAGALTLPVLAGSLLHLALCRTQYEWNLDLLVRLWKEGRAMSCGGAVSGFIAILFRSAFTTVGAVVILLILTAAAVLCALRLSPADLLDRYRDWQDGRPQYDEPEELPEQPPRRSREPRQPRSAKPQNEERKAASPRSSGRRGAAAIDIPVDDPPATVKKPTTPVTTVRPASYFDTVPGVAVPGQREKAAPIREEAPPQYENVVELRPMKTPARSPRPEPAAPPPVVDDLLPPPAPTPVRHQAPAPAAAEEPEAGVFQPDPAPEQEAGPVHEPEPIPAPVIREKEVPARNAAKLSKEEAQVRAQEELAREIQAGMDQDIAAYRYPPISLLNENPGEGVSAAGSVLCANQQRLQGALESFGVSARIADVIQGPSVVRYELELAQGVKLSKITNLSDDIALSLGAEGVLVAPIPNKISTVGIEVPKPKNLVSPVLVRDVLESKAFADSASKVSFAVGKDISGSPVVGNIAKMPHLLIAGTTGSGKSVCTNSLVISLLYKASPEEVRLIMVDPKRVEFAPYNGIPHLLIPVVTDPKKAAGALQWAVSEMMKRYQAFSEVGTRDLSAYNRLARSREDLNAMPQIVVVIDELADLMMVAAKDVEDSIVRVAQMGRAAGMHLVIATQSPRADVITGLMKANIPSRIALKVASGMESRIILDAMGAEKLGGPGDMLYAPVGQGKIRVQGCFISDAEVLNVVEFIKESGSAQYDEEVMHQVEKNAADKEKAASKSAAEPESAPGGDYDEMLPAAIDIVLDAGQVSVSMLQRRLKLGYGRAARLVDQMEEVGVAGPYEGSKARQLLISKAQWAEMKYKRGWTDAVPEEPAFDENEASGGSDGSDDEG